MLPLKSWKIPWHVFSDDTDRIADELGINRKANKLGIFCALTPVSDPPSKLQIPTSFAGSQKNNFRGFYTLLSTFNQDFSLSDNDSSLAFCFRPAKFFVLSAASKESCFFATSFRCEFHWPMVNGWWSLTVSFFLHSLQKIQRPEMVSTDLQYIGGSSGRARNCSFEVWVSLSFEAIIVVVVVDEMKLLLSRAVSCLTLSEVQSRMQFYLFFCFEKRPLSPKLSEVQSRTRFCSKKQPLRISLKSRAECNFCTKKQPLRISPKSRALHDFVPRSN